MKKINLTNFFRKDLNLKDKWWHRFLSIIFIFFFIIFTGYNLIAYSVSDIFRGDVGIQKWRNVELLSARINSEIKSIGALVKTGEKIGENDRTYVLNDQPDAYYNGVLNDVYCSNELSEKFLVIKNTRSIDSLYIRNLYKRENVSPEVFSNFIKQNGVKCLIVDAYSDTNGGRVTFLEPDKSYQDNWSFFEKSSIKTILYFIEMIPLVLIFSVLVFAGILVIYYKIFLYIVFGTKKENN
ncbi:MAG TPA: hypothetical protein DEB73_03185 [Candidatus Magasanikbacteria bacterium]|uniref:Uncharacterized protein n=2 Tax=Candidatus Magasanikiibacteriota TaxID=1752731 RepID=A0A0G0WK21_9BACT|nr:MAG: hypothetical protein UU49_C0009G0013 [Candidatus Magasanikbacteria bacterium GW2011_GWC2_41_17]KKS13159.1 MAG: hypothetical protein UU69_C0012G0007 [Candidatus Magasanikbacteria bacterium GW2011_GWA2_41_55]HBV58235.1 hypothetical protein [Candidatus Magasanikbacteria bacterium]HBX15824.1 hypothetical protein [Candidatus Magasanikbacteria bacterium]